MTSNHGNLRYSLCYPDPDHGALQKYFQVPQDADVGDLLFTIKTYWSYANSLQNDRVFLFKCEEVSVDPEDTLCDRVIMWLHKCTPEKRMSENDVLASHFPNGPAHKGEQMVDIIAATMTSLESRDKLSKLPQGPAFKIHQDRIKKAADLSKRLPSPSEGIKSESNIKGVIDKDRGIHVHRPASNYGPPTAIFHPILAKLRYRLENLDVLDELEPSSELLGTCRDFIKKSCDSYTDEATRQLVLEDILEGFISGKCNWRSSIEGGQAKPDAVWGSPVYAILELKNEFGLGGNATLQGCIVYGKICGQSDYEMFLAHSHMPVIIIGLMGNHLEISTGIFTDGVYVDQLLSEDLILDAHQSAQILKMGRVVEALKLTSAELHDYYETVKNRLNSLPSTKHLYPNPVPIRKNVAIPELEYLGKLSRRGNCTSILEPADDRQDAIYLARMKTHDADGEIKVVVKFAYRYNEQAHRILAQKGFAPHLHICVPVIGDLNMVIMDYVDGTPLLYSRIPKNYSRIYEDVKSAINLLHGENLVFGDLREANVLVKRRGGVVLVDFDWVGEDQKDRYPASWNPKVDWAAGMKPREIMKKEHDLAMLEKLGEFLDKRKGKPAPRR